LELEFDETQTPGLTMREIRGQEVPVNLVGRFALAPAQSPSCMVEGDAILVRCPLESGEIVVFADAALLDHAGPWTGSEAGLGMLTGLAFGNSGENAGN
jgi:hypothetical protein